MDENNLIFENQLLQSMKDITPPEDEISTINPWKRPINLIAWGLILTTITLNFLYLEYILPTIGVAYIFLGFSSLRNENIYFRILYFASIIKLLTHLLEIIRVTTPLNLLYYPKLPIGIGMTIFQIFIFVIFHNALKEVYKKAGKSMESSPLLWASLWTVLVFFIALSPLAQSFIAYIPLLILYILIIKSVFSIGNHLDDTGYRLENAPVKISNKSFLIGYFLLILSVGLGSNLYFNNLNLESREFIHPENTALREDLLDKGFPIEALNHLDDSDIELLKNPLHVEVDNEIVMFDPRQGTRQNHKPGDANLNSTTIFIEMPERVLYVMHYFSWFEGNPIWQDGIMISVNHEMRDREIISSGLSYSKNDKDYRADFPSLKLEGVERFSFFGSHWTEPIRGSFSFPIGSQNQAGYILYRYGTLDDDVLLAPVLFEYLNQHIPFRIPYKRTEDLFLQGSYGVGTSYHQHYSLYDSISWKEISE